MKLTSTDIVPRIGLVVLFLTGCTAAEKPLVPAAGSQGHGHGHGLEGPVEVKTPPLVRMLEFHGHLGPYVVLGYRSGETARELLESPGYFDMEAEVTSPLHTPQSCFIDGVQLGAGCTVGKRNLSVTEGERPGAVFRSKSGKAVRIELEPELPARIAQWIAEHGVEETAHRVLGMAREDVFVVTPIPR
jgi:formylmethanofuran dehydrogenase subunit E